MYKVEASLYGKRTYTLYIGCGEDINEKKN